MCLAEVTCQSWPICVAWWSMNNVEFTLWSPLTKGSRGREKERDRGRERERERGGEREREREDGAKEGAAELSTSSSTLKSFKDPLLSKVLFVCYSYFLVALISQPSSCSSSHILVGFHFCCWTHVRIKVFLIELRAKRTRSWLLSAANLSCSDGKFPGLTLPCTEISVLMSDAPSLDSRGSLSEVLMSAVITDLITWVLHTCLGVMFGLSLQIFYSRAWCVYMCVFAWVCFCMSLCVRVFRGNCEVDSGSLIS